jgi:gliding motility-associated-like protein
MIFLRTVLLGLIFLIANNSNLKAQIFEIDFSAYPNGTINNPPIWTTIYNDCDDVTINSGANYWGVFNGEFRINDIEGFNCIDEGSGPGGNNQNIFTTQVVDISVEGCVFASVDARSTGTFECSFPAAPNDDPVGAYNGHDQFTVEYSLDGGPWILFENGGYVCGSNGLPGTITTDVLLGNFLQLRITGGNQANNENYYFSNIIIDNSLGQIDNPGDQDVCTSFTFPPITGSGLSGNEAYYTLPNGNGTSYMPGDMITTGGTFYIYDSGSSCVSEESFDITITTITINTPSPLIVCYSLFPPSGEILNLDDILDELSNFDPSLTVNWFFDMAGNNPLDPTDPGDLITLISNFQTTVYASVTDGTCESNIVPVSIDLNEYPDPNDAMLMECPASNGMATFTPSDADGQITGGTPGLTVSYHNNPADAESGNSPIPGNVTTATDLTLYASVQNNAGCIAVAELDLIVDSAPTPEDASLEVCDDGNGQGVFDLTDAESTILNGQSGTVVFYENSAPSNEILNPTNYTSGPDVIYAVIDDGAGCISAPSEVTLSLITIDPNDLFLSFSPSSACGSTVIAVTINTPFDPPGNYTFDISYGPVSSGANTDITLVGVDGATNFNLGITESHLFVLNSVTGPGPSFCVVDFSPGEEYTINIDPAPDAFPASQTACPDLNGDGTFDLDLLADEINGFTGLAVDFFEDPGLTIPILNPQNYISGATTVYAVVDGGGGCESQPVEIDLLLADPPSIVDITLDQTQSCGPTSVDLIFTLPPGIDYSFDLFIIDDGGTSTSFFSGISNGSTLTFPVSETTTFEILVIGDDTNPPFCSFPLTPSPSATITIGNGSTPNTASLEACDDGSGQATFDLTLAETTVNGNTGTTVLWFTDQAGNNPINNTGSYTSSNDIVYAAIDENGCISPTAEVTLTVLDLPQASINLDNAVGCSNSADGGISVAVTGPMPYSFNWNDNTYDGQQVLTGLSAGFYALTLTDGNGCETFADIDLAAPPALNLICVVVNDETSAGASDGVASFDISGGSPLYDAVLTGPTNASLTNLNPNSYTFSNLAPGDYIITITDDNGCITDCLFTIQATTCTLNFSLDPTDVTCNGADDGSISVVINSGVPNYQYDWSDDQYDGLDELTNLPPGMYTLTITDMDGCTFEQTSTIAEPAVLVLDCRANAMGQGSGPGSYTFTYSGGTPFYLLDLAGPVNISFTENIPGSWDTAVLPPGAYTFTLTDDNGCSQSCSFVIDPICDLSLTLTGNDPLCAGAANGTLNLEITSSAMITSIDWNDNTLDGLTTANNLQAGTYSVTVVDQLGCVEMAIITLTAPAAYAVNCAATNLPSGPAATDGALTITINNGPGGPYTVTYDDGAGNAGTIAQNAMPPNSFTQNNLPPGIYQITVTNPNGCTTNCSVDLQVSPCPLSISQNDIPPTCSDSADGSVTVTPNDGTPDYTYNWSDDAFDGMSTAAGLTPGTSLSVTVTDAVGCVGLVNFTVPSPPAIVLDCSATTNPTNAGATDGSVNLTTSGGTAPYTITWTGPTNGSGNLATAGSFLIDNLGVGNYTITVMDAAGCSTSCMTTLSATNCDLVLDLQGTNPNCANSATGSLDLFIDSSPPIVSIDWNVDAFDGMEDHVNVAAGLYEVTVTDAAGCVETTSLTLVDPPAIFLNCAQVTQPSTSISTDGGVDVILSGGNFPYTISWDGPVIGMSTVNTPGTFSITDLSAGAYTVTLEDSNGCQEFCGFVLAENNTCNFSLSLTGTDPSCNGLTDGMIGFQFTNGAPDYTFVWNNSALNSQGPSGDQTGLSAGMYSVTVTDNNNCVASGMVTLTEPAAIIYSCTATTQPSDATASDGVITINFSSGPGGPYTLTYDNGNGTMGTMPITTGATPISNLPIGTYTITISNGTCSVDCQTTLVDGSCTFALSIDATNEQCAGANDGTATAMPSGGTTPYSFTWSNMAITQQITNLAPGNYTVTVTGNAGCVAIASTTIMGGQPNPISNLTTTICLEDSITVGGEVFDLDNPNGQVVLAGAASNGCDSTVVVDLSFFPASTLLVADDICLGDTVSYGGMPFFVGNSSGVIVLDNASSNGCDSTITINLTELPTGINNITSDLCAGDTLIIAGEIFDENRLIDILELPNQAANGCDSLIVVTLNLIPLVPNTFSSFLCPGDSLMVGDSILRDPGLYDILIPNGASSGCDSLVQVDLSVYPAAQGLVNGTFCAGEEVMVGDSLFNATNNSGTVVLPSASVNGCDSTIVVDLTFLPGSLSSLDTLLCFGESLTIGNQTFDELNNSGIVVLENAAANGCDSTILVSTTFRPELFASLEADTVICSNQALPASFTLVGNGQFDVSLSASTGFNLMLEDLNEGTYDINIGTGNGNDVIIDLDAVASSSGCSVTILDDQRLIRSSNLAIDVAISNSSGGTGISCAGQQDGILTVDVLSGIGPFTYAWNTAATSSSINNLPAGSYSVTVTDLPGCSQVETIEITAPTPIEASIIGTSAGCFGSKTGSITIDTIFGGVAPYDYSLDNEFFSNTSSFPTLLPDLAAGSYTVYIQDANDCQITVSAGVPEGQLLQLELGDDETIQLGDSVLIDPLYDFTPASWTWTPTEGLSQPDTFVTYAAPTETTIYQLEMADANGCTVSDIIRIFVEQDINVYIPTVFSPNGDGSNDVLMIFAGQGVAEIESFQIFDRWGNQVFIQGPFQPNDPLYGWDGRLNGEEMNAAVFVYFAQVRLITGEVVILKGDVVLLR